MLCVAADAFAHPLPDSTIFLDVDRAQVVAELRLPAAQFEIGFGKPVPRTSEALSAGLRRDIARYVADHLTASHRDGTVWCTEVRDVEIVIEPGGEHSTAGVAHESSKQRWTPADMGPQSRAMWGSVLRDFPDSNYVPYAILMTGIFLFDDWRDLLARQLLAIDRFPDSPVVEWLHTEAWRNARALRLHGVMLAKGAILRQSKRPTTRLLAFGNERR